MPPSSRLSPKPRFADPRTKARFDARYYPRLNGRTPPPRPARSRNERLQRDFLAAYYAINREYAVLVEIRNGQSPSNRKAARERAQLRRVDRALQRRDALENHCAPLGIIAEPIMRDEFAADLTLSFGNADAQGRPRTDKIQIFSAFIPVPLPSDFPAQSLLAELQRALDQT